MESWAVGGTLWLTASSTPSESSDHGISAKTLKLRIKDKHAAELRHLRAGSGRGAFKRRGSAMAAAQGKIPRFFLLRRGFTPRFYVA